MNTSLDKCVLLCANCHSEVHAGLTKLDVPKIKFTSKTCKPCGSRRVRKAKITWPPIGELLEMLAESNYSAVGRELGVSDNAIRKHIKKNKGS